MNTTVRLALVALAAAFVLSGAALSSAALAQPMKCSGEEKTCQSACAKVPLGSTSACLTECGTRKNICMRTGCWDNGRLRYCGLAKQ